LALYYCAMLALRTRLSHIGTRPISIPSSVNLSHSLDSLAIHGPNGSTSVPLMPFIRLAFPQPDTLTVSVDDPDVKKQRSMWGTTRTLISNAIHGITQGFSVPLYLVGVGYRVALEPDPFARAQRLNMKLGFSHSVLVPIPSHIKAEV